MTARKMRFGCLAVVLCCSVGFAGAQPKSSPWNVVDVPGQGDDPLHGIVFASDRVGWIFAGTNTILKTLDGGRTWSVLKTNLVSAPGSGFAKLWFADENNGWAVGELGNRPVIWQSGDGGESWTVRQLWPREWEGSIGVMLDIRFADDRHGWAVGYNGFKAIIAATDDGGQTWKTQYSGEEITGQFSRVELSDRLNVWVLSDNAVMRSWDGGESWKLSYFHSGTINDAALVSGTLSDIQVVGADQALIAGAWGFLLHTRNGVAWSQVPFKGPFAKTFFGWVKFIDRNRGWAIGTDCSIATTHDGGKTWTPEECPLAPEARAEVVTRGIARSRTKLFIIANPGRLLVRSLE